MEEKLEDYLIKELEDLEGRFKDIDVYNKESDPYDNVDQYNKAMQRLRELIIRLDRLGG